VDALQTVRGQGVEGTAGGRRIRIGTPDFVASLAGPMPDSLAIFAAGVPAATTLVALGGANGWQALFALADTLRDDAAATIAGLQRMGITTMLLSGDRRANVDAVARTLAIADARAELTPEAKRDAIAALQRAGAVVAMVGDGINDAPALAQAQVSFSLASAAPLAQWTADVVVLSDRIGLVPATLRDARRAMRILHQNFGWAIAYNVVAIPAAAMGWVTPLLAAAGMAISSLVVVGNALRLTTAPRLPAAPSIDISMPRDEPEPAWKS
jgi:Cu2+-exporting ATPase